MTFPDRTAWLAPAPLLPGATVGLFSPSEPLVGTRPERLENSLRLLVDAGFVVEFAKHAMQELYYEAATPRERASDIHELVSDNNIDALFATWGGKSCNQLLRLLDFEVLRRANKPLLGFSDVCVLQNAISYRSRIVTYYGPNVAGKLNETSHVDLKWLRSDGYQSVPNVFGDTASALWEPLSDGKAAGRLAGGNLSTFVLGTSGVGELTDGEPKVFFWESASEPPQIIDQYLTALRNRGFLEQCTAMIVGDTAYEDEPRKLRPLADTLHEVCDGLDLVIIKCPTFGHAKLENPIIPIGAWCEVDSAHATAIVSFAKQ